ncbi:hypothetical protein [Streptomyces sp. NPDC001068]|uniref:hypothetical protein n=1 Tax=Streptomyces sp. NPDC001068 TaxID=3364544 RepID=UPI0036AB76E7
MTMPVDDSTTQFVIYDSGSVAKWTYDGETPPELPEPGRIVTEAEYTTARDEIRAAIEQTRAEEEAAAEAMRLQAYQALIGAGIPDGPARQLSGYTGEAPEA